MPSSSSSVYSNSASTNRSSISFALYSPLKLGLPNTGESHNAELSVKTTALPPSVRRFSFFEYLAPRTCAFGFDLKIRYPFTFFTGPSGFTFLNLADGGFISNGFWPNSFQLSNPFAIVDKDGLFYLPLAIFGNPTQIRLFAFNSGGNQRWTFDVPSTLNLAAIGGSALDSDGSIYLVAQKLLLKLGQ